MKVNSRQSAIAIEGLIFHVVLCGDGDVDWVMLVVDGVWCGVVSIALQIAIVIKFFSYPHYIKSTQYTHVSHYIQNESIHAGTHTHSRHMTQ